MTDFCIPSSLWVDPTFVSLSAQAKSIYMYLLSGPHTNSIGVFRMPIGYIVEDFGQGDDPSARSSIADAILDLKGKKLINYDTKTSYIWVFGVKPRDLPSKEELLAAATRIPEVVEFRGEVIASLADRSKPAEPAEVAQPPAKSEVAPSAKRGHYRTNQEDLFVKAWNEMATVAGVPTITRFTTLRSKHFAARMGDPFFVDNWQEAIKKIGSIPGLCGKSGDGGWRADIDWFLRPDTIVKIMEGKYDNWKGGKGEKPDPAATLLGDIAAAKAEAERREAEQENLHGLAYSQPGAIVDDLPDSHEDNIPPW